MCQLLLAKKIKKTASTKALMDILADKSIYNKDGFAILGSSGDILRTLDKAEFNKKAKKIIKATDWNITHLRLATHGKASVDNVHLWQKNGFIFGHNGVIANYGKYGDSGISDSQDYFISLMATIKNNEPSHIAKRIKKSKFFNGGRAFLLAPQDKLYLFGDFKVYEVAGWFIISSSTLYLNETQKKYGALTMITSKMATGELDGIYLMDLNKPIDLKYMGDIPANKQSTMYNFKDYNLKDYPTKYNKNYQIGFDY